MIKKITLTVSFLFIISFSFTLAQDVPFVEDKTEETSINNIRIIQEQNPISNVILIQFIITAEGVIKNEKIVGGVTDMQEKRVLEIIKEMKQLDPWTPGKQRGRAVDVLFTLPVNIY